MYVIRLMIIEILKGNKMYVLKLNWYVCIEMGSSWFLFVFVLILYYLSVNYLINLINLVEVGFVMIRSSFCI